ncbi:glycosyltransferase family 1 protein [Bradyrhizobium sp. 1]|uniref:glycosyltransferase family 4 protein n=1 Tax=Bradyrhizobium sp. 1 TaxID=241591 RepID=UPI001FFA5F25|nr:glycosyltransferase family 1 protein [Bradyrhizobium sp. 1]MCK1396149.1 glycosyltransferase family 4 protein [Bradyrhizobium sp. 1]
MTRVLLNLPSQFGGKPSGVARMAFCLIEALIRNREFNYVLRSPWQPADLPDSLRTTNLEIVTIKRPAVMVLDVVLQTLLMPLFCRRMGIDLLVNIDPFGAPAGGRARVMIVHDLYFRVLPEQVSRREAFTTDIIYRLMLGNHDEIVTVSDATRRDLVDCYPSSADRITTVHSAATLTASSQPREAAEIEGRYVLAVGNATLNKNFKVLAKAMAALHETFPDIALVHVGSDPGETIAQTLAAAGSKLRPIRLTGIDDRRLAGLYRGATCLCVPSLYEGFCLPILEAQGEHCPVVCADRSATPEVAGKGALTFNPEDSQMLAEALRTVISQPDMRDRLVRDGIENLKRFSWDNAARQYEDVFRRALSRRGQPKRGPVAAGLT